MSHSRAWTQHDKDLCLVHKAIQLPCNAITVNTGARMARTKEIT